MHLLCEYNTEDRTRLTFAGTATQDEMCNAYVMIYPAVKDSECYSEEFDRYQGRATWTCRDAVAVSCDDKTVVVEDSIREYTPLTEPRCGQMNEASSLGNQTLPPMCTPVPSATRNSSLRECADFMCRHELRRCADAENCTTSLKCLTTHGCPLTASPAECPACDVAPVEEVSTCMADKCLPYAGDCADCANCLQCHERAFCGSQLGTGYTGDCAACGGEMCAKCEHCTGVADAVLDAVYDCLIDNCLVSALMCTQNLPCIAALGGFGGCFAGGGSIVDCYQAVNDPTRMSPEELNMLNAVIRCATEESCLHIAGQDLGELPALIPDPMQLPTPSPSAGAATGGAAGTPGGASLPLMAAALVMAMLCTWAHG